MPLTVPFVPSSLYQPNGRLVDLIRLHGEQTADAQRRAGEIQAQMWGNLGQTIQAGVNSALKARADAPIAAMNALKVQDAQDLRAGQQTIDEALKPVTPQGPVEAGQPPLQATHPYLSDDGLVDPIKVQQLLNANGQGHLAPELLKGIDAQNAAIAAYKEHQQTTATKQTVMLGSVANTTLALMKSGMPFQDAASHASSSLVATGVMPPAALQQQIQRLSQFPPDQQMAELQQMKATAARLGPTKTLADGAKEVDMFGDVIADNPKVEKPNESEVAMLAAGGDPKAIAAMKLLKPAPGPSAEQDDQRYRNIVAARAMKQPVSPQDAAWAAGYEKQKTLGVDLTAGMASNRQATAIAAQTAQQARAQDFTEQQQGRKELTEKVEQPYQTAQASAQTLRDVVAAAKQGNKVAGSLQSLEATMSAIRAQGLNRINSAEIGVTADAGSLWDKIVGKVGKLTAGEPVPADLQKDMQQFASILEKAAYKKYQEGHASITTRYKLTNEKPLPGPQIYVRDKAGLLHTAPYGTPIPPGATEE